MDYIIFIFTFCVMLFLYLHIQFHYKTSNDLEVYEIEQPTKCKLEEICDLRQPVLFDYPNDILITTFNRSALLEKYSSFDIKIRNLSDIPAMDEELYIQVPLINGLSATDKTTEDTKSKPESYIIEHNADFIEETGLLSIFKQTDSFIRPSLVTKCIYDIIMTGDGTTTPFKYDIYYRNYFMVTEGTVSVLMAPPKNKKYLSPQEDYDQFEFRSPINPWNIQPEYSADFNKVKCLEVIVPKGHILYIPAYWWYSFKTTSNSTMISFKYQTFMSVISILPKLSMHLLQSKNIQRKIAPFNDYTNQAFGCK